MEDFKIFKTLFSFSRTYKKVAESRGRINAEHSTRGKAHKDQHSRAYWPNKLLRQLTFLLPQSAVLTNNEINKIATENSLRSVVFYLSHIQCIFTASSPPLNLPSLLLWFFFSHGYYRHRTILGLSYTYDTQNTHVCSLMKRGRVVFIPINSIYPWSFREFKNCIHCCKMIAKNFTTAPWFYYYTSLVDFILTLQRKTENGSSNQKHSLGNNAPSL